MHLGEADMEEIVEEEDEEEEPEMEIKISSENVKTELDIGPNTLTVAFSDVAEGIDVVRFPLKLSQICFFRQHQRNPQRCIKNVFRQGANR